MSTMRAPQLWPRLYGICKDKKAISDRRGLILRADLDQQRGMGALFSEDCPEAMLCWLVLCCWLFRPWDDVKHWPFLPWGYQVRAMSRLWASVARGGDILVEKSRDMGASWMALYVIAWFWMFRPEFTARVVSKKESAVDSPEDPDSLFWKLTYAIETQPAWLRPDIRRGRERTHLHLYNPSNGSTVDGESSNSDAGRSNRRKVLLVDEAAFVDSLGDILRSTADATPCRILVSTPNGMNTFGKLRDKMAVDGDVLTLHWTSHPEKAAGLEYVPDVDGQSKPTSPWYRGECKRRKSPRDIAQELDIDYLASGATFFDATPLKLLRASGDLRDPVQAGEVEYDTDCTREGQAYAIRNWRYGPGSRLKLWCDLVDGRPSQDHNYVAFVDISHGAGESNSVIQVFCRETREQVAIWVDCNTPPHVLANQAVALCRWFGGQVGYTYLGFESNGPGGEFRRQLFRLDFPYVLGNPDLTRMWEPKSHQIGWQSNRDSKRQLLGDLRAAIAGRELIIHDEPTVTEIEQYVIYESGGIGPASMADTPDGGRSEHGDRAIALAGIPLMLRQIPKAVQPAAPLDWMTTDGRREMYRREHEAVHQAW